MMHIEQQRLLAIAKKVKGYLYKKSSQFLVGWQKRFWLISESQLVYYDDEALGQKKGSFEISELTDIQAQSSKELSFLFQGRRYELKAETGSDRDDWVKSLKALKNHFSGHQAGIPNRESTSTNQESAKRNNLDEFRKSSIKSQKFRASKSIQSDKILSDQILLLMVGLDRITKQIDQPRISNRILFGSFKEGYFFLISCKSLTNTFEDDDILPTDYVRPFDFNILYRIKSGDDVVKEVAKASLIGDMKMKGDKEIVLYCGSEVSLSGEADLSRFYQRLEKAVAVGKEYHNEKGIALKRNIDSFVKRYDEHKGLIERREKVKLAFQSCFIRQSAKSQLPVPTNFQTLNTFIKFLSQDLKEFVDACMVKPVPRVDLLQQYASFIHSKIYSCLHSYWNNAHTNMPSEDILKLAQLCNNYCQMINKYLQDTRMSSGPGILASIYFRKTLAEMDGEIDLIKEQVLSSTLEVKDDVITNSFTQEYGNMVAKYIRKIISYAHSEAILIECCSFINSSFNVWVNKLILVIENSNDLKLLVSLCNETSNYKTVFGVFENIIIAKGLIVSTYLKLIQDDKLSQMVMDLHSASIRRLFMILFGSINTKVLTTKFMEIDIEILSKEVLARLDTLKNVRASAYHDIQLQAIQEVISYYVSTLSRVPPANKISSETFVKKINVDRSKLQDIWKPSIGPAEMANIIEQLIVTIEFLNADSPITIRKHCMAFTSRPRSTFNLRLAKSLIELKYTLTKEQQAELYRICEDIFTQVPEQRTKSQHHSEMFQPVSKESFLDNWAAASGRRSTITQSLADKQLIQMAAVENQQSKKPLVPNSIEGYLQKKKVSSGKSKVFYQQRYFKLTPKHLEWYLNKQSKDVQNLIALNEIKKIHMHHSKDYEFIIEIGDVKYKFLAENVKECKNWVDTIQRAMNQLDKIEVKTFVVNQKNDLFVDYFTKPTLKQTPDAYNPTTNRQSVLSTLSSPGKNPIKQSSKSPAKQYQSKPTFSEKSEKQSITSIQSPTRKRNVEQPKPNLTSQRKSYIVEAEPSRGCWFGFKNCMKFS